MADLVNILARILDSERNFNGSADPMITADRGFIHIMGPDFGFWLLGTSDRGSQLSPGNLTFPLLVAGCNAVEKMTRNSDALERDGSVMPDSDVVDLLNGSTDSAINFSRSADLHTHIHPTQSTSICFSRNQFIDGDNPYSRQGRGTISSSFLHYISFFPFKFAYL